MNLGSLPTTLLVQVLHGKITCTYFESLQEGHDPIQNGPVATLEKGAVTWIGENNYQVRYTILLSRLDSIETG